MLERKVFYSNTMRIPPIATEERTRKLSGTDVDDVFDRREILKPMSGNFFKTFMDSFPILRAISLLVSFRENKDGTVEFHEKWLILKVF